MTAPSYKQCWPETVVLWGAGATCSLGLPTTQQIAQLLLQLADGDPKKVRFFEKWEGSEIGPVEDLLSLMGRKSRKRGKAAKRQFPPGAQEERLREFSEYYDWETLRKIINICPRTASGGIEATDLFNIIDLHTLSHHGFRSGPNWEDFIQPERLIPARNALKLIVQTIMFIAWKRATKHKATELAQYLSFCKFLSEAMQHEAHQLELAGHPVNERSFYLFSHAFISLNWDPVLMWLKHNAHKELNDSCGREDWHGQEAKLQLMDDLIHFQAVRQVDERADPWVLFPCNEAVVQRVNRPSTKSAKIQRVCRYYYPHGCLSWRECPNCGKLMSSLGDKWEPFSETLIPPPPLPTLASSGIPAWKSFWREDEKHWESLGKPDVLQCPFCSEITETRHTPLIMQSSLKGEHPPYIEEIQRDMRVLLENARHIVLMGYSLPKDDFIYRAVLSSRKNRSTNVKCSIVNWSNGHQNEWYVGTRLDEEVGKAEATKGSQPAPWLDTVQQATSLFGKGNVRLNLSGIPNVFLDGGQSSPDLVQNLLYPEFAFGKETVSQIRQQFLRKTISTSRGA